MTTPINPPADDREMLHWLIWKHMEGIADAILAAGFRRAVPAATQAYDSELSEVAALSAKNPPQDDGDVGAVAKLIKQCHETQAHWTCEAQALWMCEETARVVLAVLRERGWRKLDCRPGPIQWPTVTQGGSTFPYEDKGYQIWNAPGAATPPRERPVTEAMVEAAAGAETALNKSDGCPVGPYFNEKRRIRAAIAAALAVEQKDKP